MRFSLLSLEEKINSLKKIISSFESDLRVAFEKFYPQNLLENFPAVVQLNSWKENGNQIWHGHQQFSILVWLGIDAGSL